MSDSQHEAKTSGALVYPLSGSNSYMPACMLIGAITIVWNDAHEQVFRNFWYFSGLPKKQAEETFFSLRSDYVQRKRTLAAIEKYQPYPSEDKEHARKWIEKLSEKSIERNAVTHTMWDSNGFLEGKMIPSSEINNEYLTRYLSEDNQKLFGCLLNSLYVITLELNKATAIFEIHHAKSVEEVQRLGPEKFLKRFRGLPRYVENFEPLNNEQKELKEKYITKSIPVTESTMEEKAASSLKRNTTL
ncbi:hypothetical protein HF563_13100 [Acidithiobacillus ferridurans]|nr:hypothetical protein [Acidithiobacillus ferridurans]